MPGTRYPSSFDSIEGWQEASLPGNLPLNGSYKHYARSASTDSLDSSGTGTTSSGSHCGAGRSRKVSMEGPSELPRTGVKTPVVSHNPWQFVKVEPIPLYKKAVEQMKLCQETKPVQDSKTEEEELWLKKLDSWKSRRKKVIEKTTQRVEDLKLLQQEEVQVKRKSKTKTFSEIVENRAQKPRCYNLSIHGENEENHISRVNSCKRNDRKYEDYSYVFEARRKSEPSVKQNIFWSQDFVEPDPQDFTFSNIKDKFKILEEDPSDNPKEDSAICMEEDCESCGSYAMDLVPESFNCSHRAGETRDRLSELSLDISEEYGERVREYDPNDYSSIQQVESSEKIAHEDLNEHLKNIQEPDGNVHLRMRLWLNNDIEDTDFGFKIREESGMYLVDELKAKGVAVQNGLKLNDRILAVNEKSTSGRTRNAILFSMTQSVYNGYLDLTVSRSQNEGTKESENSSSVSISEEEIFSPPFVVNSQNSIKHINRSDETSGDMRKTNILNILNNDLQASQECKKPESRIVKENVITPTPAAVENVRRMDTEEELEKTYSNEILKVSSPTSVSVLPEEISYGEKKLHNQDSRPYHTAAEKNVSQVSSDFPSSVIKEGCVRMCSSSPDFDDTQLEETQKLPERKKLPQTPRSVDLVNEESGLMVSYHSNSLRNKNNHLTAGFGITPVTDKVLKKTAEHEVPQTQKSSENRSHLNLCQDNDVNHRIPPEISQTEKKSSENPNISSLQDIERKTQPNRQKVSNGFDYRYVDVDSHDKAPSPLEGSPKQTSPSSESKNVALGRSCLDMDPADDLMVSNRSNDEQKCVTSDTQDTPSRMTDSDRSEWVRYKQCQADGTAEGSPLWDSPILKHEERIFKEREESLIRRKKEIELEMKSLLWEEYNLLKEKEEYHRRVLLAEKNAHGVQSSEGTKVSQL